MNIRTGALGKFDRRRRVVAPLVVAVVENNEGWYTWVAEPVISPNGDFKIVSHDEASCRPLNNEAIDEIVQAVDRWYDAFFAKAIQAAPPRKRSSSSAK